MTIDLDRLEALVREEREQYRLSLVFPEMLLLIAEVRSLRGIAEAARAADECETRRIGYGSACRRCMDAVHARLAAYDAKGAGKWTEGLPPGYHEWAALEATP